MWMLDDGPFAMLAQRPEWYGSLAAGFVHVAGATAEAASHDRSGRRQTLLDARRDGAPLVTVHEVFMETPTAAMLYGHLRTGKQGSRDLGEDEAIAVCAIDRTDLVFVTTEKNPGCVAVALAELGRGRVASPFDMWAALAAAGQLSDEAREGLFELTRQKMQFLPGLPWRYRRPTTET